MSSYMQKIGNLIQSMKEDSFKLYDGDQDEAYDDISRALESFEDYSNAVVHMQQKLLFIYAKYEGADLREQVSQLDRKRTSCHEAAIASVSMLNRMCQRYGLGVFADVDTKDRYQVADFVGEYISQTFENRQR